MTHLPLARQVIALEIAELQALHDRLGPALDQTVDLLLDTLRRERKIVLLGVGKSGHIAEKIAATLNSTGAPSVILNPLNALHGDLGLLAGGDTLLALSQSGETREIIDLLPALLPFDPLPLVALTGNPASTLARSARLVLDTSVSREACPLNLAPTSSTTVMLALGDALAMCLLHARGFGPADFARLHPSGAIGRRLLLKVSDLMRGPGDFPLLAPETPIHDVLRAMTRLRCGAAALVHPNGSLAGIFTHGDFARHFQIDSSLGSLPVSRHMTLQPVTIPSESLAVEAIRLLRNRRIDDLIAVDPHGHPVGLLDTQDLARLNLL